MPAALRWSQLRRYTAERTDVLAPCPGWSSMLLIIGTSRNVAHEQVLLPGAIALPENLSILANFQIRSRRYSVALCSNNVPQQKRYQDVWWLGILLIKFYFCSWDIFCYPESMVITFVRVYHRYKRIVIFPQCWYVHLYSSLHLLQGASLVFLRWFLSNASVTLMTMSAPVDNWAICIFHFYWNITKRNQWTFSAFSTWRLDPRFLENKRALMSTVYVTALRFPVVDGVT